MDKSDKGKLMPDGPAAALAAAPPSPKTTIARSPSLPELNALHICTFLGSFTFTALCLGYRRFTVLRDIHLSLMVLLTIVLAVGYGPLQLWHHWRAYSSAFVRGMGSALAVWAFLLVMSVGEQLAEDQVPDRQHSSD